MAKAVLSSMATKLTRPAARITQKSRRGFAAMTPEKHKQIASMGGKASHGGGTGHSWTKEEAQVAGRKGGLISKRGPSKLKSEEQEGIGS